MNSLERNVNNDATVLYHIFKQDDKYYMDIEIIYNDGTFVKSRNNIYDPESDEFAKVYILPIGDFVYMHTDNELLDLLRKERSK